MGQNVDFQIVLSIGAWNFSDFSYEAKVDLNDYFWGNFVLRSSHQKNRPKETF